MQEKFRGSSILGCLTKCLFRSPVAAVFLAGFWFIAPDRGVAAEPGDTVVQCNAEEADSCSHELHRSALAAEAEGETSLAIERFADACALGLAPSCTMAGIARLERASETDELMVAATELGKGCLAGSDFACARLGEALGRVSEVSQEEEGIAAIALRQMGEECRATPNDSGCYEAAALLNAEERGGADLDMLSVYAQRACARGILPGCLPVGSAGRAVDETYSRQKALCLVNRADGCIALLDVLLKDEDGETIPDARAALEAACSDRVGIACANLGLYLTHGPLGQRDEVAGRHFMRAGCDGAVAQACFAFAVMHKKGIGGPVNAKRSIGLAVHACELGWAEACETLATIAQTDGPEAAGGNTAAALRSRACRLGGTESCGEGQAVAHP